MHYRMLGKTGLRVSEIGFGCGNNAGLMTRDGRQDQLEVIGRALEVGINYFDTAPAYGDGKSETNLGFCLRELAAEAIVATKVRLGAQDIGQLKSATIASVGKSLKRLQRESVDVIQLHTRVALQRGKGRFSLTPDEVLGPEGVLEGFESLRAQGKVRFFGFSGLGDPEALHTLVGSEAFHSFQAYYNLLNPSAGHPVPDRFSALNYRLIIDRAAARGMGVAVIRVLAAGALTATPEDAGGSSSEPLSSGSDHARDVARARKLGFLLNRDTPSLAQAAIRFTLMKPEVSTVLVGFSKPEHVDEAKECSTAGPLAAEALVSLKKLWDTDFGELKS